MNSLIYGFISLFINTQITICILLQSLSDNQVISVSTPTDKLQSNDERISSKNGSLYHSVSTFSNKNSSLSTPMYFSNSNLTENNGEIDFDGRIPKTDDGNSTGVYSKPNDKSNNKTEKVTQHPDVFEVKEHLINMIKRILFNYRNSVLDSKNLQNENGKNDNVRISANKLLNLADIKHIFYPSFNAFITNLSNAGLEKFQIKLMNTCATESTPKNTICKQYDKDYFNEKETNSVSSLMMINGISNILSELYDSGNGRSGGDEIKTFNSKNHKYNTDELKKHCLRFHIPGYNVSQQTITTFVNSLMRQVLLNKLTSTLTNRVDVKNLFNNFSDFQSKKNKCFNSDKPNLMSVTNQYLNTDEMLDFSGKSLISNLEQYFSNDDNDTDKYFTHNLAQLSDDREDKEYSVELFRQYGKLSPNVNY